MGGGDISNTASVSLPGGYLGPSPVEATADADIVDPVPGGIQIGSPDDVAEELGPDTTLTLEVDVIAHGDNNPDLVYYELENVGSFILMDWVRIQVGDGYTWYTIYDWGDRALDTNTNVSGYDPLVERDQFWVDIPTAPPLYNDTGITIDIDSKVPAPGTYPYIRFISSPYGAGDDSGQTDIDAIEVFP
jgi:hypothetical protein